MTQSDMHGKVCLVTGAGSGIGKATATALAKQGATVVMICRNQSKGEVVRSEIRESSGNNSIGLLLADLSSQASIRHLTQQCQETYPQIHVLINNAGVALPRRSVTSEGIEMTFAVNVLAPFLLSTLLLDQLKAGAPSRIINVASSIQRPLDFANLQQEKRYKGWQMYGQTKFALILLTYELARRLQGTGVTANCLHPGFISTNLGRNASGVTRLLQRLFASSPEQGAATSVYLASSPDVEGENGKYFVKSKEARSSIGTYDEAASLRLWEVCVQLTGASAFLQADENFPNR
jgi:NAD(P)-dependent dehydrogenase (short-subunit alcohol dehydrogenase family)